MPKELSMSRKNIYRRNESGKVRTERIITGYVKYRHPEIYEEAYSFYNDLNELYPDKKDLRRCNEFEWLKTGTGETMRKYYQRKGGRTKRTDNMVLSIELMSKTAVENSSSPKVTRETSMASDLPLVSDEELEQMTEVTQETVVETSMASDLPLVSDEELEQMTEVTQETVVETSTTPEVTQETVVETSTTPEVSQEIAVETTMASDLPLVSDEELGQIINDLREDPDLSNFFDNIDFEIDDCPLW